MIQVPALEFQRNFGKYQDLAQREPIVITSHGRPAFVLMPAEEYAALMTVKKRAFMTAEAEAEIIESVRRAEMDQRHEYLNELMK